MRKGAWMWAMMAVAAVVVRWMGGGAWRYSVPEHLLGHGVVEEANFLDEATVSELLEATRESSPIYATNKEPEVFRTEHDNIGEAVAFDKGCPKLMVVNNEGDACILPGRLDVAKHFLSSGGVMGLKESVSTLVGRVQPFLHYILDYKTRPLTKRLLESPKVVDFAKRVCPKDRQYLDPFQFNFVVQVPGQTVATHIDAVYFRRASRFHMPQWLLAVMQFSGLFADDLVPQVQVVAYYHRWTDDRAGDFYFWNDTSRPTRIVPAPKSANSVDGSRVVHAAEVYVPNAAPPPLPRAARNTLEYVGPDSSFEHDDHIWHVKSNNRTLRVYRESELRLSAVYRCRCFRDEADKRRFDLQQQDPWSIDYVLSVLRQDLARNNILALDANISKYDLGILLVDHYVKYPLSHTALIPFNFCALTELLPSLAPLFNLFCS